MLFFGGLRRAGEQIISCIRTCLVKPEFSEWHNSWLSLHFAGTLSFASLLADRETDTFYHGKQTWNNTIVKSNLAFGHINIFTYSSYSILLYSQIKEPKKREIMQIFLKNFYVPARIKILKILLKMCFFKNICFIVEDCRIRRARVEVGISHTQICISGICKKSSKYAKGYCIQPI